MFSTILRSRYFLWLILSIPLVAISVRYKIGGLYYGEVVHLTGELSIRLMMLTMAATPLMLMFPGRGLPRWLQKNRRYLGVASFAYAALHTVVYLNKTALLPEILKDSLLPEYLTGWVAMLVLVLLAATSNDQAARWLKRTWKKIHRLVYAAAVLSFAHWILVAFNPLPAVLHLSILAGLEAYRIWKLQRIRALAQ